MRKVYYTCPFVPRELIAACGLEPCRVAPLPRQAGAFRAEGICTMTQGWLEFLAEQTAEQSAAVFTTSCDQMRRAFDMYTSRCTAPGFLLNVPSMNDPLSEDYYLLELQRLQTFLCAYSGRSTLEVSYDRNDDRGRQNDLHCRRQIAVTGGPLADSLYQEAAELAHAAGAHLFNLTETALHEVYFAQNPPCRHSLPELAGAYFQIPSIWKRPNEAFFVFLDQSLAGRDIRGIIIFRQLFCDLWHSQICEFRRRFSFPVLDIELNGTFSLSAGAASRIQAFLEAIAQ